MDAAAEEGRDNDNEGTEAEKRSAADAAAGLEPRESQLAAAADVVIIVVVVV